MSEDVPVRVFVSYSHDSEEHRQWVLELASRLRNEGVDCWIDRFDPDPSDGWPRWMEQQLAQAQFVLVVCTATYRRRFDGRETPDRGLGVNWEAQLVTRYLYERRERPRFVPVIPDGLQGNVVPDPLGNRSRYQLPSQYEELYRLLTNQPEAVPPPLGHLKRMSPISDGIWSTPSPLTTERVAELSQHVRKSLATAARQWLDTECDPFIVPSLSRPERNPEPRALADPDRAWEPLGAEELQALFQGRLPEQANRVRIVGDSGMGKTALLHYVEAETASAEHGWLPIRIEGLAAYDWQRKRDELLETIAERLLHKHLPDGVTAKERLDWLRELAEQGRVVFLLDALDQTDKQLSEVGLKGFLDSAGIAQCPVLITLRPEKESSAVFQQTAWSALRTDVFDERRQREFLGDTADLLLPKEHEYLLVSASYERQQQWADLLAIPLLLRMMRDLAKAPVRDGRGGQLAGLRNRHALYRQAVGYLIDQGLAGAEMSENKGVFDSPGDVIDFLKELGWLTVSQDAENFTGVMKGTAFKRWRKRQRSFLAALKQVDVVTEHSVLGDYDQEGLAWRHRSFSEYFAGLHLVGLPVEQIGEVIQRHGREPGWSWVFRFALSEAAHQGAAASYGTEQLAGDLIRFGNPFLVFDAIERDGLELPGYLDRLCRWLVHRDENWDERDYTEAWQESHVPKMDDRWIELLESMLDRRYRDSRCLHPAWELVEASDEAWAVRIRDRFLGEFPAMLQDRSCEEHSVAQSLAIPKGFVHCPPDPAKDRDTFEMGARDGESGALNWEYPQHPVRVTPFCLQRTPVSNRQYELFDPSHRFRRDRSPGDDHPAVWVNWYMAELFCKWLGASYRLPTEAEWEYACRAGTETAYSFGDEPDELGDYGWFEENSGNQTQPVGLKKPNPWGLYDMHGTVWEWCLDGHDPNYYQQFADEIAVDPKGAEEATNRLIRGGSWRDGARDCRAANRFGSVPGNRFVHLGFRVAAVPLSPAQSQPSASPGSGAGSVG